MSRGPRSTGGSGSVPLAKAAWGLAAPGRRIWWVVIPAVLAYLFLATRFHLFMVDDAYISFRYARNLADGHGLVYNAGERVEGYTNFLWVLLVELGMKLRQDPEAVARVLGMAAGVATIVAVARLASLRSVSPATFWIAPILVALHPANVVWAGGGLEGPLFACFVTWGVGLVACASRERALSPISAVLLALAALTRPEGVLVAGVVAVLALSLQPRPSGRSLLLWAGVFLAMWVPYFVWRWSYYGYPLPNTFYAKVDLHGSAIGRGLAYLNAFARDSGYWLVLPMAGVLLLRPGRPVLIAAGTAAAYVAYVVFIGGDKLSMFRFFVPVIGLLGLLVAWGAEGWVRRFGSRRALQWAAGLGLAAAAVFAARPNFAGTSYESMRWEMKETATWKEIGIWFRQNAAPGESLAVVPAGAMPYFSGLKTVDMLGLNDPVIAHTRVQMGRGEAGHEKYNLEYVLRRAPGLVVVGVYDATPQPLTLDKMVIPYYPIEQALLASPEFQRRYRPEMGRIPRGYFVYFRRVEEAEGPQR